ncbi:transposase, partial [Acetonema longum]
MRTVTEQPTPLEETMTVNRAHYEALQAENAQLNQKVNWLMEQMRLARHKRFGSSSEKSQYDALNLFNEAEVTADHKRPEPDLTAVQTHYRRKTKESRDRL